MTQLSSNWKALSKTLRKKTVASKSAEPTLKKEPTPQAQTKHAKTTACPPTAPISKKVDIPKKDQASTITEKCENDPGDTILRDMSILDRVLSSGDTFSSSLSDDGDDGVKPATGSRKRKHASLSSEKSESISGASLTNDASSGEVDHSSTKRHATASKSATPIYGETKTGKHVAIDCEMVGAGPNGSRSMLARVSIVNFHGYTILDAYALPEEPITDYRTEFSGIRPSILKRLGRPFKEVQQEVAEIIKDRILIGHAIKYDLTALRLHHPSRLIRDTSTYQAFRNPRTGSAQALRKLSLELLGITIQEGEHSSEVDARATMQLYHLHRIEWEKQIKRREI
ncbi:hypothetical protein BASA50_006548 [Batrachochytrium salamandrivorans]|uniref:RNA exonuclease 4 n=1 Tax=Batrachochytrium salamandrivorans TaxID=1357716 RepID=A0ABQ8F9R6_9FUNG|nr:hypothetical protein BASA60_004156 [Batrachochytrium salamandrivorans]KAH6582891.1 hypothetical protein BASA61_008302 [Batrachochytrium salamandrivorans]KAH6594599.1 hypothetical protein BASA50_006548 [Batrachochytrium salamandrivorans]